MNVAKISNTINHLNNRFRNGGLIWGMKIIHDSHFGYDLGYYIKPSKIVMFAEELNLVTGTTKGEFHTTSSVIQYTKDNMELMMKKYKYKLTF